MKQRQITHQERLALRRIARGLAALEATQREARINRPPRDKMLRSNQIRTK